MTRDEGEAPWPSMSKPVAGEVKYATELECPCCGDVGALADADRMFTDGQDLVCGCRGCVSCDAETEPYVSVDDDCNCQERR